MVRRVFLLIMTIFGWCSGALGYNITNIEFVSQNDTLDETQMATLAYAQMLIKAKPQLTTENFKYEDYRATSTNGNITINPVINESYFITYDNGNSDLHIPAIVKNTSDTISCKVVVYNRNETVFYEIEMIIPSNNMTSYLESAVFDYAMIPEDFCGMLVTYNQKGRFSWWAKYKNGKKIKTSEPIDGNDEINYKKFLQGVPTMYYPDGKNRQGVLYERHERDLQGSGWGKYGIKF